MIEVVPLFGDHLKEVALELVNGRKGLHLVIQNVSNMLSIDLGTNTVSDTSKIKYNLC